MLETRKLKDDQIDVFKILTRYEILIEVCFTLEGSKRSTGHEVVLVKDQHGLNI